MGWGAAIIEQGGGFIKQGVGAPSSSREKGTQFCFGQHLPCEIGLKPAQQAHRPFFGPRAVGRASCRAGWGPGRRAAGGGRRTTSCAPAGHRPQATGHGPRAGGRPAAHQRAGGRPAAHQRAGGRPAAHQRAGGRPAAHQLRTSCAPAAHQRAAIHGPRIKLTERAPSGLESLMPREHECHALGAWRGPAADTGPKKNPGKSPG